MEGNYKEHVLGLQNRRFLLAYENLLSVEDVWLISSFVFYQKSWLTRLLLLFDGKIKYNSLESNYYLEKIVKGEIGFPRFSYQALMPFTVCEGL